MIAPVSWIDRFLGGDAIVPLLIPACLCMATGYLLVRQPLRGAMPWSPLRGWGGILGAVLILLGVWLFLLLIVDLWGIAFA